MLIVVRIILLETKERYLPPHLRNKPNRESDGNLRETYNQGELIQ